MSRIDSRVLRAAAATALAAALATSAGCLSSTHAEDPVAGPAQRSAVVAADHGDTLMVEASALLPLDEASARAWVDSVSGQGVWVGRAGVAPAVSVELEAPGWTRVSIEDGAFRVGPEGEAAADALRAQWVAELAALRARVTP